MSSIVSRSPPPSGLTNQAKDFFWMSIRFGTSIDLSRRANVRRVREASTEAKTATPPGLGVERARARQHSTTKSTIHQGGAHENTTRPGPIPVCGGKDAVDGVAVKYSCGR